MRGKRSAPNGVTLYHGPSVLDGEPIIAIATGIADPSRNRKTGVMVQTWIMNADVPPLEAARTGKDESVCGACALRGQALKGRACYVTLHDAPTRVWNCFQQGAYPNVESSGTRWAKHRPVRFGSYGDPAAVPAATWFSLAARCRHWTGYTHEWRRRDVQPLRFLLMASVENEADAWEALAAGWRTYRIRLPGEQLLPLESVCPASEEADWKSTCSICRQCDGARLHDLRRSYAVYAHGHSQAIFKRASLRIVS